MDNPDPYNRALRQYFVNPAHACDLPEEYTDILVSEAGELSLGAKVRLMLALEDGVIQAMRFQAWGCPHLIAAAEALCERFEGQPVESLAHFEPQELMQRLAVPVEKTGRILVLEDALDLLRHRAVANETGQ